MRAFLPRLTVTAVVLVAPIALADGPFPVQARDDTARMERIADGVYAIIHDDATDEWPHGNTGVIVGDDGVIVVDSTYLPSRARADIALIRSVTDQPVRYLVNTHWHFDHNNGAIAYREAYPSVAVVSERETRTFIEINASYWSKMSTAAHSSRRAALQALEDQLAAAHDDRGKPLDAAERVRLESAVRRRQAELAELATLEIVTPDLVFDGSLTLTVGGRQVELEDRGPANSPHDVTVYLPKERVLFTGDIVVQAPIPYVGASWPVPWIAVLQELERIPVAVLVPGHGPAMQDHTYTRQVQALLEGVATRVADMARKGKTLEEVTQSLDAGDLRRGVPAWNDPALDEDWKLTMEILIERTWRSVRGQSG
jgi:glyoxylase-like metal-dependent hydrolase (beta-lactamase superfamily II)